MSIESSATDALANSMLNMTESESSKLSKVLFPETHTNEIVVAGEKITLRPLTIKFANRLFAALQPFAEAFGKSFSAESAGLNDLAVSSLCSASSILCEFYGLSELKTKIAEQDVTMSDLQLLCNHQQALNGANDFLLGPLRILILAMRLVEITATEQMENLLALMHITPASAKSGDAPSTP